MYDLFICKHRYTFVGFHKRDKIKTSKYTSSGSSIRCQKKERVWSIPIKSQNDLNSYNTVISSNIINKHLKKKKKKRRQDLYKHKYYTIFSSFSFCFLPRPHNDTPLCCICIKESPLCSKRKGRNCNSADIRISSPQILSHFLVIKQ